MEYRRIVVALDPDSTAGAPVFERALGLAAAGQGKQLLIASCLDARTAAENEDRVGTMAGLDASNSQSALRQQREAALERARGWAQGLAKQAQGQGVSAHTTVDVGPPGALLCELARNWKADLLVLGLTRRGPLMDRLLGSVTQYVVHHAPCSVLLVH
jgi:nucleotide-binding universal stress UspA family protein